MQFPSALARGSRHRHVPSHTNQWVRGQVFTAKTYRRELTTMPDGPGPTSNILMILMCDGQEDAARTCPHYPGWPAISLRPVRPGISRRRAAAARPYRRGRPLAHPRRTIVNAILYVNRARCAWRYCRKPFRPGAPSTATSPPPATTGARCTTANATKPRRPPDATRGPPR